MIFAILVPISALPLLLLVYFLWGLGDYLFTMLAWFVGALVILIVVYFGNILPPVPFIVLGAIGLFCAPFIGLQIRDKREQQRKLKEQDSSGIGTISKRPDMLNSRLNISLSIRMRSTSSGGWVRPTY
jgi:hypothetical protein